MINLKISFYRYIVRMSKPYNEIKYKFSLGQIFFQGCIYLISINITDFFQLFLSMFLFSSE